MFGARDRLYYIRVGVLFFLRGCFMHVLYRVLVNVLLVLRAHRFVTLCGFAVFVIAGASVIAIANAENAWNVRCSEQLGKTEKHCEIVQRLNVKETNQRIVEMAITYAPDTQKTVGALILPLGTLVQSGAVLRVGEGEPYQINIHHCLANGCYAYINMPPALLEAFKGEEKAVLSVHDMTKKRFNIELSLAGFAKAYEKLL